MGRSRDDRCVNSFDYSDGLTDVNICKTYQTVNYKHVNYTSVKGRKEGRKGGTEEIREGGKEGREGQEGREEGK